MAKTYSTLTSVATGDVLTATGYNNVQTTLNNHTVPPAIELVRTTAINPYTAGADITWSSASYQTDTSPTAMWTSGATVTIQTAGIYLLTMMLDVRTTLAMTGVTTSFKKGGTVGAYNYISDSTNSPRAMLSSVQSLAASDTLTFQINYSNGGTVQINGAASGADQSRLNITWLGKTA